jgi:hypothetical protein
LKLSSRDPKPTRDRLSNRENIPKFLKLSSRDPKPTRGRLSNRENIPKNETHKKKNSSKPMAVFGMGYGKT